MTLTDSSGRRRSGFTLMEMVLAVGVCAVVLAAVNGVFFSGAHLCESAIRTLDDALPVESAMATLRRDLQGAMMPASTNGIFAGDFKVGDVSSPGLSQNVAIELYTTTGALRDNEPWGDVQRVTYALRAAAGRRQLVRGAARNLLAAVPPSPEEQTLLENVASLDFECYDGTQWRTAWDTTAGDTNLPVAVRARLQLAGAPGDEGRGRPPVVLVVLLDGLSGTNRVSIAGTASGTRGVEVQVSGNMPERLAYDLRADTPRRGSQVSGIRFQDGTAKFNLMTSLPTPDTRHLTPFLTSFSAPIYLATCIPEATLK